jgi:hypothetical protein|tara:strand:+ start:417 stop:737 length:321 start_codon:yes stop_codon:yes gene_type:complete
MGREEDAMSRSIPSASPRSLYNRSNKKRITDGTSVHALEMAMSQYLNSTGAGDYDLPVLTGEKLVESKRRNVPNYSIRHKTKLSWCPERAVNFQGLCSPPSTKYAN